MHIARYQWLIFDVPIFTSTRTNNTTHRNDTQKLRHSAATNAHRNTSTHTHTQARTHTLTRTHMCARTHATSARTRCKLRRIRAPCFAGQAGRRLRSKWLLSVCGPLHSRTPAPYTQPAEALSQTA